MSSSTIRPLSTRPRDAQCDESESTCGLTCPERPEFFAGQLLKEDDLDALVKWTQERLRLSRLREGWGVVCGMEVSYDASDPRKPKLLVSPGYAVNCCGDDIVACSPDPLEVSPSIREICSKSSADNVAIVADVWVYPYGEPFQPEIARRAGCGAATASCEYTRVKDSAVAKLKPSIDPPTPTDCGTAAYNDCLKIIEKVKQASGTAAVKNILTTEAAKMRQFYSIAKSVDDATDEDLEDEAFLADILLKMVVDCRKRSLLIAPCEDCDDEGGVRLARVTLTYPNGRPDCCTVSEIDNYPPYRRDFGRHPWPVPPVNIAKVLWRTDAEARRMLEPYGFEVNSTAIGKPQTLSDLYTLLELDFDSLCFPPERIDLGTVNGRVVSVDAIE